MSKISFSFHLPHSIGWCPLVLLGTVSIASLCQGQQPTAIPAVPPAASAPATNGAPPVPAAAAKPAGPDATALDYLYNKKPQEGSAAAAAAQDKMRADDKTRALDALAGADSPMEPAFEQFLNAAEADPAKLKAYLGNYDKVVALLLQKKPADAYQALFAMATYEGDAGISRQLANRVQTVWDADAATRTGLGRQ